MENLFENTAAVDGETLAGASSIKSAMSRQCHSFAGVVHDYIDGPGLFISSPASAGIVATETPVDCGISVGLILDGSN